MLKAASPILVALLLAAIAGTVSAQSQGPVKIGILNDQSGAYSSTTGMGSVVAAKLAVEDVGGQLFGKPIEVVAADHAHKPDVGSSIARRWFDVEGVGAIFDFYSSGVALAVQKVAEDKDRIVVMSMASSRDIGGKSCSTHGMQWGNDGYSVANLIVKGAAATTPNTWYFLTVDYTAGHSVEKDLRMLLEAAGGKATGSVRFPIGSPDFSSFLLQAQASKAKNIGMIGGGADVTNSIKQANEFQIREAGQRFIPVTMTTDDVFALGNRATAGMPLVQSFYWDASEASRAWTERFKKVHGRMPTDPQANVYSAVRHYLKAVKSAGTVDTKAVLAKMREMPVEDFFTEGARIRADGRLMRSLYYAVVKSPEQMKSPEDILTLEKKYPGEEAFVPVEISECPLLKKKG